MKKCVLSLALVGAFTATASAQYLKGFNSGDLADAVIINGSDVGEESVSLESSATEELRLRRL